MALTNLLNYQPVRWNFALSTTSLYIQQLPSKRNQHLDEINISLKTVVWGLIKIKTDMPTGREKYIWMPTDSHPHFPLFPQTDHSSVYILETFLENATSSTSMSKAIMSMVRNSAPIPPAIFYRGQLNWTGLQLSVVHLDVMPRKTPTSPENRSIAPATEATLKPLILLSCLKWFLIEYEIKIQSWSSSSEPSLAWIEAGYLKSHLNSNIKEANSCPQLNYTCLEDNFL